jgi:hypothetical protein
VRVKKCPYCGLQSFSRPRSDSKDRICTTCHFHIEEGCHKLYAQLEFKKQDLWIGIYWERKFISKIVLRTDIWICLIPMFPLHIWFRDYIGGKDG